MSPDDLLLRAMDQLREDWRESFSELKTDINKRIDDIQEDVKDQGNKIVELEKAQIRLAEEYTPPSTKMVITEPSAAESKIKKGAVSISFAGLGGVILWVLQKLWP